MRQHPAPVEPSTVRTARQALDRAQRELHGHLAANATAAIVDAARYRVLRAHDLLEQRWHEAALSVAR